MHRPLSVAAAFAPRATGLTLALTFVAAAAPGCGGRATGPRPPLPPPPAARTEDPDGPHRAAVAAQIQPFIDGELVSGIVVGLYDAGKVEIYGFGAGPGGKPPTGTTLFEIGSITKVYTSLLLADAIQRREVSLETPVAELVPPGITVPTKDKVAITLKHLALHSSGLPRLPAGIDPAATDPYTAYTEDKLYQDLVSTELVTAPGTQIVYSNFGAGLLGHVLGRKIGGGYAAALRTRVLDPLGLADTTVNVPAAGKARLAPGTTDDLAPAPTWSFDALAGAGALVSTMRDQLRLVDAELDAAAGAKTALRPAMRFTQEPQLDEHGEAQNEGLGWQIDSQGRYWHNGQTGGYHSFLGFDPKTRRGVVILSATATTLVDRLAEILYGVLQGEAPAPVKFPTAEQLARFAGSYDLTGSKLVVTAVGKRLYIEGPGEPKHRLSPISDHEFLLESLGALAVFQADGDQIARLVFVIGDHQMVAPRVP